jgi:hypothetical protein
MLIMDASKNHDAERGNAPVERAGWGMGVSQEAKGNVCEMMVELKVVEVSRKKRKEENTWESSRPGGTNNMEEKRKPTQSLIGAVRI